MGQSQSYVVSDGCKNHDKENVKKPVHKVYEKVVGSLGGCLGKKETDRSPLQDVYRPSNKGWPKVLEGSQETKKFCPERDLNESELRDVCDEEWEGIRSMTSDLERVKTASAVFMNPVSSVPTANLTYHGFRKGDMKVVTPGSVFLKEGGLEPVTGFKRKRGEVEDEESKRPKMVRFSYCKMKMRSLMYRKYAEFGNVRDFQAYLRHHDVGQEETENFLSFYRQVGEVMISETQMDQIMDQENMWFEMPKFYGPGDEIYCRSCGFKHKF